MSEPTREELLAMIKWAHEATEKALWLKGHAARQEMARVCSNINLHFKPYKEAT
jgi:hypothetical protein